MAKPSLTKHSPIDKQPNALGLDFNDLTIDRDADVPIGVQLAWALRSRIGDGRLEPNQRLPGLRELAEATGVNVNTIRAVYQRLEQDGLINSQQGSGTFVAAAPRSPSAVGAIAANAAREARATGVDPREVAAALYVSPESLAQAADEAADRSELAQRRLLRRQIASLERALSQIEADHPRLAPPSGRRRGIGPALLSAGELAQVRGHLVRRLAAVQGAIDQQLLAGARDSRPEPVPARPRRAAKAATTKTPKRAPAPRSTARPSPAST